MVLLPISLDTKCADTNNKGTHGTYQHLCEERQARWLRYGREARRWAGPVFNQRFEDAQRDDHLPAKLKAEFLGILAWFIEGARQWASNGLAIPEAVRNASDEYMAEHDDIALWIEACCVQEPGAAIPSAAAYASFKEWKIRNGEQPPAQKAFSPRLERWGAGKKRVPTGIVFTGLGLANTFPVPPLPRPPPPMQGVQGQPITPVCVCIRVYTVQMGEPYRPYMAAISAISAI